MDERIIRRGDIFYVQRTDSTGSEQQGGRPAIVVSNDCSNKRAPVVEVVYLTTKIKPNLPTHIFVFASEKPSVALCEQITTVDKACLQRYLGKLTEKEIERLNAALLTSLELSVEKETSKIKLVSSFGENVFNISKENTRRLMDYAFELATHKDTFVPSEETKGFKGFMFIECDSCKKRRAFCIKSPITEAECECGAVTTLRNIVPAFVRCSCGQSFKYLTNVTDEEICIECLNCGNDVHLKMNERGTAYTTVADRRSADNG